MLEGSHLPASGLLDRGSERDALERLVAGVRAGQSRVLVLRGEAGIGKTALLEHVVRAAEGCRIARAAGVESEMELAFAGLHQLCAPMLGRLGHLPIPQREALNTAFGLSAGAPPDRFLVGLAVLSLLADTAEEQPLVCIVDDAQWLDRVSAQTLAFVARRILAERVGMVFARRESPDEEPFKGLPELVIAGLPEDDAHRLLDATILGPLDAQVRRRIIGEAGGNPLALLELPRGRRPITLAGGFGLPGNMALTGRIEQGFARQLESFPADTRRLLLLAAAEPVGDVTLLWRAAERLELGIDAAAPAQAAGLIALGARVWFRHPLVRSAAYRATTAHDRRQAHEALANATDARSDPDRHAWHRAHAADGPDEGVAAELEHSASRAAARGGIAAAAAFLERATELTPDPGGRGARALAAARAKFESAAPDAALALLEVAEMCPLDDLQRARLARLRAEITFALRRGKDAPPLLLDAARQLEAIDPAAARETYVEAIGAAIYASRFYADSGVRKAAEAARGAPPPPQPPRSIDLILDGMATWFTEPHSVGAPPLRLALQAFRNETLVGHEATMRWLLLCPVVVAATMFTLWDDDALHALTTRAVQLARQTGALTTLPIALIQLTGPHVFAGEFAAASGTVHEAEAIAVATGNTPVVNGALFLGAWRGIEAEALALITASVDSATARGEGLVLAMASYARSVLYNGLARYEAALDAAQRATELDAHVGWSLAELIEAATRSGRQELAAPALLHLEERARAADTDWALGILARSRALMSERQLADALYREAIERLERTRIRVELARAHLVYGEWLRRENRRGDARAQLHTAHRMFSRFGMEAFAERARRELLATGENLRRITPETRDSLTPQEAQVARLARDGHTNSEIGAQLFISPRTVEYHLHKVFRKLDVSTRRELRAALTEQFT
jgi:DNA-binding CsgD family transcriptional regulator